MAVHHRDFDVGRGPLAAVVVLGVAVEIVIIIVNGVPVFRGVVAVVSRGPCGVLREGEELGQWR